MKNPLISVIIPTYNHEKYIGETLESVLGQSYVNTEIIVVNDGSTDSTVEVLKPFKKHISLITSENKGLGAACNLALKSSKGELLARIDSDDLWDPEYLDKQYRNLLEHRSDASFCQTQNFFSSDISELRQQQISINIEPMRGLSMQSALIRRAVFDEIGLYEEDRKIHADMHWIGRFMDSSFIHADLPEVLLHRRIHNDNMGHDKGDSSFIEAARALLQQRRLLKDQIKDMPS